MPPILSTSHCEFNGARLCAHARKTILLILIQIIFTSFLFGHYKRLPSINNIFTRVSFFSSLFLCFVFIAYFFRGFAGACVDLGRFSQFVYSLVCAITHSSLDGFQPNLVQHFPHVCSTCHTVFNLKNTLECVCEWLLLCRLIFSITWTPDK